MQLPFNAALVLNPIELCISLPGLYPPEDGEGPAKHLNGVIGYEIETPDGEFLRDNSEFGTYSPEIAQEALRELFTRLAPMLAEGIVKEIERQRAAVPEAA